jgi:Ran GTPase-activating protein (RanGAP) involved in mRNA processing and transport
MSTTDGLIEPLNYLYFSTDQMIKLCRYQTPRRTVFAHLKTTLATHQTVKFLNLYDYKVKPDDMADLISHLSEFSLTRIHMWYENVNNRVATALANALPLCSLRELELCQGRIGPEGAKALAGALGELETLKLSTNHIKDQGAVYIGEALATNTKLLILNLSNNRIGNAGARAIAESLPSTRIHTLVLYGNNIGLGGIDALCKALPLSPHLTKLNLDGNEIGVFSVNRLAHALPQSKLEVLTLRNALSTGVVDLAPLVEAIGRTYTLRELDLSHNQVITISDVEALTRAIKGHPRIREVTLDFCELSDDVLYEFRERLLETCGDRAQTMTVMCSVFHLPRIHSPLRMLPIELMRGVAAMLPVIDD